MDGSTNASNVGGNVGSDTKPIKVVDGKAVAVGYDLAKASQLTDGSVTKIGTSNVGSDTSPVKLVNGVPTAVNNTLLPLNTIISGVRVSNVFIGSGDNVIMMSAFNNSFEARLVVVAQGSECRLQLEKWSLDGASLLGQSVLKTL